MLIAAVGGLFFHDKQQTADLGKAQTENGQLKAQVDTDQEAIAQMRSQLQQLTAQAARAASASSLSNPSVPAQPGYRSPLTTDHLQGPGFH